MGQERKNVPIWLGRVGDMLDLLEISRFLSPANLATLYKVEMRLALESFPTSLVLFDLIQKSDIRMLKDRNITRHYKTASHEYQLLEQRKEHNFKSEVFLKFTHKLCLQF